jgi:hypothetical protein
MHIDIRVKQIKQLLDGIVGLLFVIIGAILLLTVYSVVMHFALHGLNGTSSV